MGQYKTPGDIPAIWKDFGGKPFEGIRGIVADFKFPEGQTFNSADWNLITHATTRDGDFIQAQPFIMDMTAGEKGVLSFTQRETTVWDAMTP